MDRKLIKKLEAVNEIENPYSTSEPQNDAWYENFIEELAKHETFGDEEIKQAMATVFGADAKDMKLEDMKKELEELIRDKELFIVDGKYKWAEHKSGLQHENKVNEKEYGAVERRDIFEYGRIVNDAMDKIRQAHDAVNQLAALKENGKAPKKFTDRFHDKAVNELNKLGTIRQALASIEVDMQKFLDI